MTTASTPPAFEGGRQPFWNSERMGALLADVGRLRPVGSTGLIGLDGLLGGGLAPGVYILAGEPGAGKSSLALQVADYSAQFGTRGCVFASLEMGASQLVCKSLTRMSAGMHENPLAFGEIAALMPRLGSGESGRAAMLAETVEAYMSNIAPALSTQDAVGTVSSISALYDSLPGGELPPVLVLDYVQVVGREKNDAGVTDVQALSAVMKGLCSLSKRHGIPVLALSSQNRGKRGTAVLDSLAGCSELEYSATAVMFLSVDGADAEERRDNAEADPRPVTLTVAKNRFGALGSVPLWFFPSQSRFIER